MNGFVLAGVAIAAFAAGAALVSFRYERELRRMARFLDQREPTGNARMTAFVRTRGVLGIARGVNAELDELQNERIASQQARQAFQAGLTCLSHDIRTPLAGAQGYLQLVEDEADPAAKERYLSAAAHRLDDVRVLLDDLFSFAQVHDPSFEVAYEPVRPADVLGDVLAGLYPQFRERGWEPRAAGRRGGRAGRCRGARAHLPQLDGERASPRRGGARHRAARRARDVREPRG